MLISDEKHHALLTLVHRLRIGINPINDFENLDNLNVPWYIQNGIILLCQETRRAGSTILQDLQVFKGGKWPLPQEMNLKVTDQEHSENINKGII